MMAPPRQSALSRPLIACLVIALALRVLLWLWFDQREPLIWDEQDYNRIAVNLAEHGEFALAVGSPTSLRPPVYPFFLAAVYRIFGIENFEVARLVQLGLSLLTGLLVFRLGSVVYTPTVGAWAATACLLYPSLLGFNNLLLTETLFTLLFVGALLTTVWALERASIRWLVGAGMLVGVAALTRSVMLPCGLLMVPYICFAWPEAKRRVIAGLVFAIALAATLSPWAIRNTRLEGTFVIVDTLGGRNLMQGNYQFTTLERPWDVESNDSGNVYFQVLSAEHSPSELHTQGQINRLATQHGLRFIVENPELTLQRDLVKLVRFWGLERELIAGAFRGYFGPIPGGVAGILAVVIVLSYIVTAIAGVIGAVLTPPSWRYHGLMMLTIGTICAIHVVTFGHSRYHLPLVPLLLLYGTNAMFARRGIVRGHGPRLWLVGGLAAALILGWLWEVALADGGLILPILSSSGG
jgi:hypothetical protein